MKKSPPQRGPDFKKQLQYGNATILEELGMKPATHQDDANQGEISLENLSDLDADLLIIWPYPADLEEKFKSLPQYSALPSVKNGSAFFIDQKTAGQINGSGVRGVNKLLDTLKPMLETLR